MINNYIDNAWHEVKGIQNTIEQLSRHTKIKQYRISDDLVRYTIVEWLKHCGIEVQCRGDKILFN